MSDAYTTWFQDRWGEESPPDSPPQYTDANLKEAFHASAQRLAIALNDQLTKARSAHNAPGPREPSRNKPRPSRPPSSTPRATPA